VKKILKQLGLLNVKCKPPPQANDLSPETLIFYDDSTSLPRAAHYLIDPDYSVDLSRRSTWNEDGSPPLKKSSRSQHGQLCQNLLKFSIHLQKSMLTTMPAFVIWIAIVSDRLTTRYVAK
jgi:hypothetical protein